MVNFDKYSRVQDCRQALVAGQPVIVVDLATEVVAQLVVPGDRLSTAAAAFMIRYSSGILCAALSATDCHRLRLPSMSGVEGNGGDSLTVSVDARDGISTGISAYDRALTIRLLSSPDATHEDFVRPGHVMPMRIASQGECGVSLVLDWVRRTTGSTSAAYATLVSEHDLVSMPDMDEIRLFSVAHGTPWVAMHELAPIHAAA